MKFSKKEVIDLGKAWLFLSLIFTFAYGKGFSVFPYAFVISGVSFLLHELAHKYVAQRARCFAEFQSYDKMLILGVIMSVFGFIFAAPGGVYVKGAHRALHGKIALAGPLTNLAIAAVLFSLTFILNSYQEFLSIGIYLNALLAVFNLIPFPPFDGYAVWKWNKLAYVLSAVASGLCFVLILG